MNISMGVFCAELYHDEVLSDHGLSYVAKRAEDVPSDFDAVCLAMMRGAPYPVYAGASELSIYAKHGRGVDGNHVFRTVHDWFHFAYHHDFTVPRETNLGLIHAINAREWLLNDPHYRQWADDAAAVLLADTLGQTWVYHVTHGFVEDQCEFVERVLASVGKTALCNLLRLVNQPEAALASFDALVQPHDILCGLVVTQEAA